MTTRSVPESLLRNGALAEAQSITATGRLIGASQAENSASVTSGPCRLNLASLPSYEPWPIRTTQSGSRPLALSARADLSRSRSGVPPSPGSARPIWIDSAPAFSAADLPLAGPLAELDLVLGRARGPDHDEHARAVGGVGADGRESQGEGEQV